MIDKFTVSRVVDGDTFDVIPKWKWDGRSGNRVRIRNFNAAELDATGEKGKRALHQKQVLTALILNKKVELRYVQRIDQFDRLVCSVYCNGKNLEYVLTSKEHDYDEIRTAFRSALKHKN
ncbi:MAG: hypothetical protein OXO49_03130 [Gammaproteobacteria bacterium]|nr:hypothetical protein [Gammaproteobacteria bacterium]MDE0251972.1 hypothetical protein [Gammaproteobacteria bacterium]MDE0402920.1 hypothetical protein [Gammaproteobacteria bacterium]